MHCSKQDGPVRACKANINRLSGKPPPSPWLLYTDAFTHQNFCTQTLLHFTYQHFYTQTPLHTNSFTHRRSYTPTLRHTDAFTHTGAFAHQCFYTPTLLYTAVLTHTQTLLYTHAFTHTHRQTLLHTAAFTHTQTLLHTRTHLHRQTLLHTDAFYIRTLLHTNAFRRFYTPTLLHTNTFIHSRFDKQLLWHTHTHQNSNLASVFDDRSSFRAKGLRGALISCEMGARCPSKSPEHSFDQLFLLVLEYVWPKMTKFSESCLILLVCLVLLPSGQPHYHHNWQFEYD